MASSDDSSRRRRATFTQLETLWEFLNSHKEIATGYNKSARAREYSRRMWQSIAEALNSQGEGAVKDWKGWSSYWVDYKAKLKKRAAVVRAAQNRTGGGPLDVAPLTDIEKKFLGLLGDGFGTGLPNIQVDPFPTTSNNTASLASEPLFIQVEEVPPTHEVPVEAHEVQQEPQKTLQLLPSTNDAVEPPVLQPERRRRRRRQSQMSQEEARRTLVELSRGRLQVETRIGHNLQQLLNTLERIANTLDRKRPDALNKYLQIIQTFVPRRESNPLPPASQADLRPPRHSGRHK